VISRHKVSHHFLPHFYVDPSFVENFVGQSHPLHPNRVHHRAHALSLFSLFAYLQILLILTATLYLVRLKAPQILGEVTFSAEQKLLAEQSMDCYQKAIGQKGYGRITTEIQEAPVFYYAEDYHQQYLAKNPAGYCGLGGTGVCYESAAQVIEASNSST